MTDNIELSDCEKTIMNVDEPIYGDLITEIELVDDPAADDKGKESLTDLVGQQTSEPPAETAEIPTEPEAFEASNVLTQDDAVSNFFTVDAKTDDFDNDMIIGDLDNEGIDFKNETDVAECHHEYETKKLLFGDCEDIVEVVSNETEQPEVVVAQEEVIVPQNEEVIAEEEQIVSQGADIIPKEEEIVSQEIETVSQEVIVPEEVEIVPQEDVLVPQEIIVVPQEEILVPQEEILVPEEEIIIIPLEEELVQEAELAPEEEEALLQEEQKPEDTEVTEAELDKPEPNPEEIDPCFEIAAQTEESSECHLLRYHRFPTDAAARQRWLRVCGRVVPNVATARVCSRHFSPRDYEPSAPGGEKRPRLRKGAVPNPVPEEDTPEVLLAVGLRHNRKDGGLPYDSECHLLRYHRFPADAAARQRWLRVCGRVVPNVATARVCSRHFSPRDYEPSAPGGEKRPRLRKGAVPNPVPEEDTPEVLLAVGLRHNRKDGGLPYDLNRMHVMEDVEEGCDVSGALPSSPGHAEQRPDPPKLSTEVSTPIEKPPTNETPESTTLPADQSPPAQNGLSEHSPVTESVPETTETQEKPAASPETSKKPEETLEQVEVQQASPKSTIEPSQEEPTVEETKKEPVDETKPVSPSAEVKDSQEEVKRDNEDDSSSSESSRSTQSSKRKCDDDDSNASPAKKLRNQIQQQYANHDRILNEYIEASNCGTVDDLQVHTEQLLAEIRTLNELAKEKEREWNNILHVKKVKEELLLRMQRKKQCLLMSSGLGDKNDMEWDISDQNEDQLNNKNNSFKQSGNGNPMMVPVVSSSPVGYMNSKSSHKQDKMYSSKSRSILPKNTSIDMNGQGECRQGRQGPILDVRSIIADYRQRHPETVPRRGRRLKSVLNTSHNDSGGKMSASGNVLSMASLALGSGSQVRHGNSDVSNELGLLLSTMDSVRQENSRPSSADSSMTSLLSGNSEAAMSFKDVLVQFARLSQSERQELQAQAAASLAAAAAASKPPPPPYPEVTLHPVPTVQTTQVPVTQNSSLLHGILTKTQPRVDSKPTTFSPTLARLLTAPERASNNSAQAMYTAALNSGVSISDLLQTTAAKSRNEITITPVGQYGQNMKHKDVEHVEEEEAEDSADRLVIDEGNEVNAGDRSRTDNGSEAGDDVPQCQGCHQKSAQFVCAGCGNQWYCSRDCQVAAWDEHSEVCSG